MGYLGIVVPERKQAINGAMLGMLSAGVGVGSRETSYSPSGLAVFDLLPVDNV